MQSKKHALRKRMSPDPPRTKLRDHVTNLRKGLPPQLSLGSAALGICLCFIARTALFRRNRHLVF